MDSNSTKLPEQMKACVVSEYGTNFNKSVSYVENFQAPNPQQLKPTEVIVEIDVAGVNPAETKLASGIISMMFPLKFPCVLGNDFCGKVVALGSSVTRFKIGDAVFGEKITGAHAHFIAIEEKLLAMKPAGLPVDDAAACPSALSTAFQSLQKVTSIKPDEESILIVGASGGVGSYSVLLAKHYYKYKQVIAVCSQKNESYVKSLGADLVIDYTTRDFVEQIQEKNIQVVAVLSAVSDFVDHFYSILKPASKGGVYLAVAGPPYLEQGGLVNMLWFGASTMRNKFWSFFDYPKYEFIMAEGVGEELEMLGKWLVEKQLTGKILITKLELKDAAKAYEQSHSKRTVGKMVLTI